jgi:heme-degrading monooxygenase HmoA
MFVVLWEFDVKSECEERFTLVYSSSGDWARLFATNTGFRSTTLLRNVTEPLKFVTMDVWHSREDHEHFLRSSGDAYRELDARCEGLTTRERRLSSLMRTCGSWVCFS